MGPSGPRLSPTHRIISDWFRHKLDYSDLSGSPTLGPAVDPGRQDRHHGSVYLFSFSPARVSQLILIFLLQQPSSTRIRFFLFFHIKEQNNVQIQSSSGNMIKAQISARFDHVTQMLFIGCSQLEHLVALMEEI